MLDQDGRNLIASPKNYKEVIEELLTMLFENLKVSERNKILFNERISFNHILNWFLMIKSWGHEEKDKFLPSYNIA